MRELPRQTASALVPRKSPRALSDVLIADATRDSLLRLKRERDQRSMLARHGIRPRNRLLFHGPPGNGKTATAEALSNLFDLPLLVANYAQMIDSYLGGSEKAIVAVFDQIGSQPCVLFFDEADSLLSSRVSCRQSADQAHNNSVNLILTNLDRLSPEVVFIAATNRVDDLDEALDRRIDARFEFPPPTDAEKLAFLKILKNGYPILKQKQSASNHELVRTRIPEIVHHSPSFAVMEKRIIDLVREILLGS